MIIPNQDDSWDDDNLGITFEVNSLYDTLYLQTNIAENLLQIGQNTTPLKSSISVDFQPNFQVILPDKTSVYYLNKNERNFQKTVWNKIGRAHV